MAATAAVTAVAVVVIVVVIKAVVTAVVAAAVLIGERHSNRNSHTRSPSDPHACAERFTFISVSLQFRGAGGSIIPISQMKQ